MKLGKLEKKILITLAQSYPKKDKFIRYPNEGSNIRGLAEKIFGSKAFETQYSSFYGNVIRNSEKATLCRALNRLWRKGLIKKCKPSYIRRWVREEYSHIGFMEKCLEGLWCYGYNEPAQFISLPRYELPHGTKIWWMLTEKGKKKVKLLGSQI